MRRWGALLWYETRAQLLSWAAARWFVLGLSAGQIVPPLTGMALWHVVYPDRATVSTYYLALLITAAATASYEDHTFAHSIYQGTISDVLLRPQPVVLAPLGANLAIRGWISLVTVPVVLAVAAAAGAPAPTGLLAAVPALVIAGVLRFAFTWALAMTAFWTERVHAITGFGAMVTYLLGGSAAPVAFLPAPWGTVAAALPFYAMLGFPAEVAAGSPSVPLVTGLGLQAAWTALFAALGALLWRRGRHRYTMVGA